METPNTPKARTAAARISRALLVIISAVGTVLALSVPALIGTVATPGVAATATTSLTWSTPVDIDGSNDLSSVSCASSSFCVAVDDGGYALIYNGSSWSTPQEIDNNPLESVSCTSSSFCVAVDGPGYAITYNGSTSTTPP